MWTPFKDEENDDDTGDTLKEKGRKSDRPKSGSRGDTGTGDEVKIDLGTNTADEQESDEIDTLFNDRNSETEINIFDDESRDDNNEIETEVQVLSYEINKKDSCEIEKKSTGNVLSDDECPGVSVNNNDIGQTFKVRVHTDAKQKMESPLTDFTVENKDIISSLDNASRDTLQYLLNLSSSHAETIPTGEVTESVIYEVFVDGKENVILQDTSDVATLLGDIWKKSATTGSQESSNNNTSPFDSGDDTDSTNNSQSESRDKKQESLLEQHGDDEDLDEKINVENERDRLFKFIANTEISQNVSVTSPMAQNDNEPEVDVEIKELVSKKSLNIRFRNAALFRGGLAQRDETLAGNLENANTNELIHLVSPNGQVSNNVRTNGITGDVAYEIIIDSPRENVVVDDMSDIVSIIRAHYGQHV